MKTLTKLSAFLVGLLMLLAAFSPALAISSLITAPGMSTANINGSTAESYNWGGYAVEASSVTSASGSWIVPAITPISGASPTTTYYSAFWVGIDGFTSSTVEQTGILSETTAGVTTHFAWYEFYPAGMYEIVTATSTSTGQSTPATVTPGDTMTATVTYVGSTGSIFGSPSSPLSSARSVFGSPSGAFSSPGRDPPRRQPSGSEFTATITDTTAGWTYTYTGTVSNAARSSAEWIVETPSVDGRLATLADFGTVPFSSCSAATTSGSISLSGSAFYAITIVADNKALTPMATPSAFSSGGFSVTWDSAGP